MAHRAQVTPPNPGTEGRDGWWQSKKKGGLGGPKPYVHGYTTPPLEASKDGEKGGDFCDPYFGLPTATVEAPQLDRFKIMIEPVCMGPNWE